jgi:hypothetical protein
MEFLRITTKLRLQQSACTSPKSERRQKELDFVISLVWLANRYFASLARPKMPSGANVFQISNIQEEETEV